MVGFDKCGKFGRICSGLIGVLVMLHARRVWNSYMFIYTNITLVVEKSYTSYREISFSFLRTLRN